MKQTIFSSTIRTLRKKTGYTQEEVSNKLNIQRQTYCTAGDHHRIGPAIQCIRGLSCPGRAGHQQSIEKDAFEGQAVRRIQFSVKKRPEGGP